MSDGVHTLTPRICVGWLCNIVFFVGSEQLAKNLSVYKPIGDVAISLIPCLRPAGLVGLGPGPSHHHLQLLGSPSPFVYTVSKNSYSLSPVTWIVAAHIHKLYMKLKPLYISFLNLCGNVHPCLSRDKERSRGSVQKCISLCLNVIVTWEWDYVSHKTTKTN